ncbi:hypothetical protein [Phocaeicola plebeius]|jgi:hypothetical protein|uniref:hypothetical protein n=1 Tax=Phocaeicola plebeius TaxID=310297 RepID=UPI0026E94673|nr:hypothetical protein [Phocaeicola plebeius]
MPTIRQIEEIFSPERIITICEDEFGPLAEQIAFNIMTKRTNSGADVNALNVPEETTGATAESLKTIHEATNGGLTVSFVGRKGIKNIDEGSSPQDVQEEFGSFEAFRNAIERWARVKESRWNLDPRSINAYGVASSVWDHGSVLYQKGGGTEIMKDLLPEVVDRISKKITEELDTSIYQLLDATIEL